MGIELLLFGTHGCSRIDRGGSRDGEVSERTHRQFAKYTAAAGLRATSSERTQEYGFCAWRLIAIATPWSRPTNGTWICLPAHPQRSNISGCCPDIINAFLRYLRTLDCILECANKRARY